MYETFTYDKVHVFALWSFAGMLVNKGRVRSVQCDPNLHFEFAFLFLSVVLLIP
jgi:hypothetical protein